MLLAWSNLVRLAGQAARQDEDRLVTGILHAMETSDAL